MGGPYQTTNSNQNTAQNSATNQASSMNYGSNTGSQYGQSTAQNSTQTYDPSALGLSYLQAGTTPAINNISQYYNPYQQDVINSTMAQLGQQSGQQQAGIVGNAISNDALGGDRQGVAQQIGATQFENQVAAPTLSNLESQGFNTALAGANTANAQNLQAAGMAGGTTTGATAGQTLGQTLSSTLGSMDSAQSAASASAGTGSGSSTTTQNPGMMGTLGSIGALAMMLKDGGAVACRDSGGGVSSDGGLSEIMALLKSLPQAQTQPVSVQLPQAPAMKAPQQQSPTQMQQLGQKAGQGLGNLFNSMADGTPQGNGLIGKIGNLGSDASANGGWNTSTQSAGGLGNGLSNLGSSIGDAFSGIFANGGEVARAGGGATVSMPNVSMPSLSGLSLSAPNVSMPSMPSVAMPTVPFPWVPQAFSSGGKGSGGAVRGFADGGDTGFTLPADNGGLETIDPQPLIPGLSSLLDPEQHGGLSLGDRLANSTDRLTGNPETYAAAPSAADIMSFDVNHPKATPSPQDGSGLTPLDGKGLSALTSSDVELGGAPSDALLTKTPSVGLGAGLGTLTQQAGDNSTAVEKGLSGVSTDQLPAGTPLKGDTSADVSQVQAGQNDTNIKTVAPPPGQLPKKGVAGIQVDELKAAGANDSAIRGILWNSKDESGFNPGLRVADQPRWGGEAHFAHGLYQEGGAEWNNYSAWLKQNYPGADWRDPRMQTRFLAQNLQENYPAVWDRMQKGTPEQAAQAFVHGYLKPRADLDAARSSQYGRGVPSIDDIVNGATGSIKSLGENVGSGIQGAASGIGSGIQSAGEGIGGGLSGVFNGLKGIVSRGLDNSGDQQQHPYKTPQDQQSGGLLQRLFGINFNPLNLSHDERMAAFKAFATMGATGNLGQGMLAGANSLQQASGLHTQAQMDALKLEKLRQEVEGGGKGTIEKIKGADGSEQLVLVDPRKGTVNPLQLNGTAQAGNASAMPQGLSGPDAMEWLKYNNPAMAERAQEFIEGRAQIPSGRGLQPQDRQALQAAEQITGGKVSQANYPAKQSTMKSFWGEGKSAQQITTLGTAYRHLGEFDQTIDPLGNYSDASMINGPRNALRYQTDGAYRDAVGDFEGARVIARGEALKAAKGAGVINEKEEAELNKVLSANAPPDAMHSSVRSLMSKMNDKIEETTNSYNRQMGYKPGDYGYKTAKDFVSPEAGAIMDKYSGRGAASRVQAATAQGKSDMAPSGPVQVATPQDAMKLPSGTQFVTPDGRVKVRP